MLRRRFGGLHVSKLRGGLLPLSNSGLDGALRGARPFFWCRSRLGWSSFVGRHDIGSDGVGLGDAVSVEVIEGAKVSWKGVNVYFGRWRDTGGHGASRPSPSRQGKGINILKAWQHLIWVPKYKVQKRYSATL